MTLEALLLQDRKNSLIWWLSSLSDGLNRGKSQRHQSQATPNFQVWSSWMGHVHCPRTNRGGTELQLLSHRSYGWMIQQGLYKEQDQIN
jgi:hypothetical protein